MADETPENINQTGDAAAKAAPQVQQYASSVDSAGAAQQNFNYHAEKSGNVLNNVGNIVNNVKTAFTDTSRITENQANIFSLLSTAAIGASASLKELAKFDTTGIASFQNQIDGVIESALRAEKPLASLLSLGTNFFGIDTKKLMGAGGDLGKLTALIKEAAKNMFEGVDSALKFQNSFYQLMGTTGQLGNVFASAGEDLHGLNNLLQDQTKLITGTSAATGVLAPIVSQYYMQLGKIPGALQATASGANDATKATTLLQEAIQLAHGSGREFTDIVNNLTTAWEMYNLKGEKAEVFTARISDLASSLGIRVKDTEGFLTHMADSFKLLGDNTEGAAKIFNEFFGGLQQHGLGVKPAIEVISQMTDAVGKLSLAQKAFISSRTGGPGGLLGGIEIERELRKGNVDQVLNKIRQSFMQQVGGNIITQDEVKTQQDAARFQRQRMLLQSGAFGNIAANDDQATRILEAFKSGGGTKEFKEAGQMLTQQLGRGAALESKSNTQLNQIIKLLEEIKIQGGFRGLNLGQQAFTEAAGGALGAKLATNRQTGAQQAYMAAQHIRGENLSQTYANEAFSGMAKAIQELTLSFQGAAKIIKTTLPTESEAQKVKQSQLDYNKLLRSVDEKAKQVRENKNLSDEDRNSELMQLALARENLMTNAIASATEIMPNTNKKTISSGNNAMLPSGTDKNITVNVFVDGKVQSTQQTINEGTINIR